MIGKYFSISIEEQSASSSKVAIHYKTKHWVLRSSDFLRTISQTSLKVSVEGISHEKTDSH